MREKDIVQTVTIKHQATGTEATKAAVNSVAGAVKNLGDAVEATTAKEEKSDRQSARVIDRFKSIERSVNPAAKALADYERAQTIVGRAVNQNADLQARGAAVLQVYKDRMTAAGVASGDMSKETRLARHELINLSRQIQDVGVSLSSGQSPMTVLVQQGTQIADIFASSGASVRGFFSSAIGWAGRFAVSTAGVVSGVAAIATGAVALAASWSSAQREMDKVLSTPGGAASGVGRGDLNRIAQQGSSTLGLSVGEAREAATAFAATGKIYEANILSATKITKQFAQAMGVDVSEAIKQIAQDLQTPGASAAEWAKKIQGIDADTVKYIRSLEVMGDRQGAIKALIEAATPGLAKQAEHVGLATKAWDAYANTVAGHFDTIKKGAARVGDTITGSNFFGSRSDEELLEQARGTRSSLQGMDTTGLDQQSVDAFTEALRRANDEVDRLEAKLSEAAEQNQRFVNLSNEVNAFSQSINAAEVRADGLIQKLNQLDEYQSQRQSRGEGADPAAERAAVLARQLLVTTVEAGQAEQRRAMYVAQTAQKYSDVSTSTALVLNNLRAQLGVAQAITTAAQMKAQQEASYIALLAQGVSSMDAQKIAAQQLAVSQAQATTSVMQQVQSLKDQNTMIEARANGTEAAAAAAIAYRTAIDSGADSTAAAALKAETLKNHMLQAASAANSFGSSIQLAANAAGSGADFETGEPRPGGPSFTESDTLTGKQFSSMSNVGFALYLASQRLGDAQSVINSSLTGGVGSALNTLKGTQFQNQLRTGIGGSYDVNNIRSGFGTQGDITSAVSQLYDLKLAQAGDDKAAKQAIYADQLAWLQQQPGTIQNLQAQVAIQRAMKDLTDAVNANTDAQNASLNPLYDGRSALKIGYYKAATGLEGIVGGSGGVDSTPVHMMLTPGEHIKVTPAGSTANDNSKTIINNVNNYFGSGESNSRRSLRQASQGFAQMIAASS